MEAGLSLGKIMKAIVPSDRVVVINAAGQVIYRGFAANFEHTAISDERPEFLEENSKVPSVYDVTQPSVRNVIGKTGIRRATVIKDFDGRYRYLTERECWRLQGYTDEDFERAKSVQKRRGRYYTALYHQAGNSIAVPIFESIFRKIIKGEIEEERA